MTKIRMAVSAALVATVGLVGSQATFAATNPQTGPSDLFVAVWDSTTSTSYVEDLGTPWSDFQAGGALTNPAGDVTTWTLPSNLTTLLGGSADNFSVFAANQSAQPYHLFLGINGTAPSIQSGNVSNNAVPNISQYINNFMSGSTLSVVGTGTSYFASGAAGSINPGSNGGSYNTTVFANLGAATPGTGSLNFYEYTQGVHTTTSISPNAVGNATGQGVFTLSGNVLTYTLAGSSPTVPLPAAGWLLISGLLGLGTVSRRRAASAA